MSCFCALSQCYDRRRYACSPSWILKISCGELRSPVVPIGLLAIPCRYIGRTADPSACWSSAEMGMLVRRNKLANAKTWVRNCLSSNS